MSRKHRADAAALITAAGSGTRMGTGTKKEYRQLNGKPVLVHSIEQFLSTESFTRIVVTLPAGQSARAAELLSPYLDLSAIEFTDGGASRQESVFRGLEYLDAAAGKTVPELVLIHDGARPWISADLIRRVLEGAEQFGACLPVVPAVNAMKTIDESGFISAHLERNNLFSAQTPQGFRFAPILDAHRRAARDAVACFDDTELYSRYEGRVFTVKGDPANLKITYAGDLEFKPCG